MCIGDTKRLKIITCIFKSTNALGVLGFNKVFKKSKILVKSNVMLLSKPHLKEILVFIKNYI